MVLCDGAADAAAWQTASCRLLTARVSDEDDHLGRTMRMSAGSLSRRALREAALSGARWMSLARLVAELVAFGSGVALARLVPPEEFGYAAVALIVVAVSGAFLGQGLGASLVQMSVATPTHFQAGVLLSISIEVSD